MPNGNMITIRLEDYLILRARIAGDMTSSGHFPLHDVLTGASLSTANTIASLMDSKCFDIIMRQSEVRLDIGCAVDLEMFARIVPVGTERRLQITNHLDNVFDADTHSIHRIIGFRGGTRASKVMLQRAQDMQLAGFSLQAGSGNNTPHR